ncbi:MAG: hypothetical protein ACR2OO_00665 [Thermomicrobiales bacterium]
MRSERHHQADLFQERAAMAGLLPELRSEVCLLIQALLAEAAGLGRTEATQAIRQEGGDDQDHA